MFARIKKVKTAKSTYEYLQIVESYRENNKIKQRVVSTLGRVDQLQEQGAIDGILTSLSRFSSHIEIMNAVKDGNVKAKWAKSWGSVLVLEKLWKDIGLDRILRKLFKNYGYQFDVERAVFASVCQRILKPGSDLSATRWLDSVYAEGFNELELHHLYRCMDFLADNQPRIEKDLFDRGRDLFDYGADLVFFDTTSIYFEGLGPEGLAEYGHSKDHRPDRKQVVVGIVLSRKGYPLSCQFWEGNKADVKTLRRIIDLVKRRFRLERVVLVSDRGMVSVDNLIELEAAGVDYIVGVPMRRYVDVEKAVVNAPGFFQARSPSFWFKEVLHNGCRYVLCYNEEQAVKDRATRENIVEKLKTTLKEQGAKSLVGNKGFRKFLKMDSTNAKIDYAKLKKDARFDGKYVLLTSLTPTDLDAEETAVSYKRLWQVERAHRDLKSLLDVRPVFHQRCDRVQGHIFCHFLALFLKTALQKELKKKKIELPWDQVLTDLEAFKAIHFEWNGQPYLLRTEFQGCAHRVFQAVGLKPPQTLQPLTC